MKDEEINYLKALDKFEHFLEIETKNKHGLYDANIGSKFKKENESIIYPQSRMLDDLVKSESVKAVPNPPYPFPKYYFVKKHSIGHFESALANEVIQEKTNSEQQEIKDSEKIIKELQKKNLELGIGEFEYKKTIREQETTIRNQQIQLNKLNLIKLYYWLGGTATTAILVALHKYWDGIKKLLCI